MPDERAEPVVHHRTLDAFAAQRIRPVEHDELDARLRARFHRQAHRADERVGAHAGVLQIINQRVEALEHRGSRLARCAVERMDRQPGALVRLVADVFPRLHVAINSVFRPEQRDDPHARREAQQVNR